ncbi:glutathione S-transferase, partial [Pseudomonas canadensis]|uniref:glutathione S-transferase n=2 Tax=Pseudomonadota TaxID=1224 RepID=UPI0030D8043B
MLTIWGRLNSHNVKKVAWFAEELALPYVRHDVGGQFGMSDAYLALNPNALVPTIEDDGFILWESNAILRYLAARHGGKSWWPEDPVQRAQADRWMDWQFDYADAQRGAFLHLIRRPLAERDPAVIAASAAACAAKMQILD